TSTKTVRLILQALLGSSTGNFFPMPSGFDVTSGRRTKSNLHAPAHYRVELHSWVCVTRRPLESDKRFDTARRVCSAAYVRCAVATTHERASFLSERRTRGARAARRTSMPSRDSGERVADGVDHQLQIVGLADDLQGVCLAHQLVERGLVGGGE